VKGSVRPAPTRQPTRENLFAAAGLGESSKANPSQQRSTPARAWTAAGRACRRPGRMARGPVGARTTALQWLMRIGGAVGELHGALRGEVRTDAGPGLDALHCSAGRVEGGRRDGAAEWEWQPRVGEIRNADRYDGDGPDSRVKLSFAAAGGDGRDVESRCPDGAVRRPSQIVRPLRYG
jgi:hypothetical protein